MKNIKYKLSMFLMLFMLLTGGTQLAMAQGNSGDAPGNSGNAPGNSANAPGHSGDTQADSVDRPAKSEQSSNKNRNLGHGNASRGIKAVIQSNRQIFYTGDLVEIGVRFPRGSQLIRSGEVDAWLIIFDPQASLIAVPLSAEATSETTNLFRIEEVDVDFLPEGVYQMGVVLTVPNGDPMNLTDWYNGMLGLLTVRGLTVSAGSLEIDDDGDGFVDDDNSDDGFVDDDDDASD